MVNILLCAATNLFRTYLIYKFIYVFVGGAEKEKRVEVFAYGIFFLINTTLYLLFREVWINILSNLIGIGVLLLLYTRSLRTICFVTTIIYVINAGCDAICIPLFIHYQNGQIFNQFYSVVTVFLIFISELLTEKIISYKKGADTIQNLPLIVVPICSIGIIAFIAYNQTISNKEIIFISFGLLLINFVVFYLYNYLVKLLSQKYENEMLKLSMQGYSNQINTILQSEERVKALRHDMKHHMNELKFLAKQNDTGAIQEYIDHMMEFIRNSDEMVASENIEMDSILNYMLQKAKEQNLSVKVNVQLPKAMEHSFDIVIILGNLLENAIEAAIQTEEKFLSVDIQMHQGILKILIENSYSGKVLLHKDENQREFLASTKKNPSQHGIGISNIKRIVDKYNGILEVNYEDTRFQVKVLLYMSMQRK